MHSILTNDHIVVSGQPNNKNHRSAIKGRDKKQVLLGWEVIIWENR